MRAVKESLDQFYVKEYESTWINDLEKFETLGKHEKKRKKVKSKEKKEETEEIADLKEASDD